MVFNRVPGPDDFGSENTRDLRPCGRLKCVTPELFIRVFFYIRVLYERIFLGSDCECTILTLDTKRCEISSGTKINSLRTDNQARHQDGPKSQLGLLVSLCP
ncbi:unnamed protein product [Allacma fusca]|uniref:Uncharacterized protein n=1 Tax=Allacma fusca TaxID=39272 RepID=A0A8J2K551_9HEXA|nr:unnamed protein product [Allacma fusca]